MQNSIGIRTPFILGLSTLLILILTIGCIVSPEDSDVGGGGSVPATSTPESTPTDEAPPTEVEGLEGTVESVDSDARLLMLTDASGESVMVNISQSTVITINGTERSLEDIQAGDSVVVEVDQEADEAVSVTVESQSEADASTQEGTVESVDAAAGLLMLTDANGESVIVNVSQSTVVTINGAEGSLEDIQAGDSVEAEMEPDTDLAVSMAVESQSEADASTQEGTVEGVDPDAGQITLAVTGSETVTINVEQSTVITIDGVEGSLEDIQAGDLVQVEMEPDTDLAISMAVESQSEADASTQEGTVETVDAAAGQITLAVTGSETVTINVEQSTVITIDGVEGSLEDIQAGDSVQVEVDQDTDVATSIIVESQSEADASTQEGTVQSVDPDAGQITLALASGSFVTVNVNQSTTVIINGSAGTLEDIQAGDSVQVEVDQDADVAVSVAVDGEAEADTSTQEGTVQSVDPDAGQITLAATGSETITVNVDQSTVVTINGAEGSLEDIQAGDSVQVEVDQDADVAISLTVEHDEATADGEITEVDLLSQTLTVETEDDRVLHLQLLILEGSTEVIIDGGQGSLMDLVHGASVEITYNPETMVVTTIYIHTGVSN